MSVEQGLDPQQIAAVAERLAAQGEQLEQVHRSGTAMMGVLVHSWAGADVEFFASSWEQASTQIESMSASLREAAKVLHQQAQDQQRASGGSATAGAGRSTSPGVRLSNPREGKPWDGVTDFGKGLLLPSKGVVDTAKKIADHTSDGIRSGADRVKDGIDEGVDRVNEGMDWLEDRADQARDWGQDKAEQLAEASVVVAEQLLLTGASGLAGPIVLELGEQLGVWQDGHGEAGHVTELGADTSVTDPSGARHPKIRQPTSLDEIMLSTSDAYQNDGTVRITEITHPNGTTAYIVNTPGTQNWERGTTPNPLDALGNLSTINGGSSASSEAVWAAMEEAGIPPGAPVLTVGHSQGGMINQALLSDPRFTERFNVTHSVTYGSPVDAIPDTSGARQLHLAHDKDEVPKLDYGNFPRPSRLSDDASVVTLPNPDGVYEHSIGEYLGVGQPFGLPESTKPPGTVSELGVAGHEVGDTRSGLGRAGPLATR